MYQHDLYEDDDDRRPRGADVQPRVRARAVVLRGKATRSRAPWLGLVGSIQRTLGPLYAGRKLLDYRDVADNVTKSVFEGGLLGDGELERRRASTVDGRTIAPHGFVAQAADGSVLAAALGSTWSGVTFPGGAR